MHMRTWLLHNLGLKLLSLALAVFLWIVVLGEQKVEVTVHVPLQLALPQDFFLTNDPVDSLDIHIRGPKTLVTSLAPREIELDELRVKWAEGENIILVRPDMVRVPRGVQVVGITPQRVRVVLERSGEREVEIAPRVEGGPPEGYVVRRVVAVPPRIRIVGPTGELRRITRVHTLPISLTGQTASFSARVLLEPVGRQVQVQDSGSVTVEVEIGRKPS
jgi:YbbR domain-containing protein